MTLITLIIESFLSSEQITLTLSVQRPYLLTYSYDIVLLYSLGCIRPKPTCRTLITLIIESLLSSEQITLTLSVQRPYLLIYSYDIVLLYSLGYIQTLPTCQTLMTLITLIIESFLSSEQITLTLSVQRPYLLTYSYIVLLYSIGCIYTIPTCQTLITLITLIIESFLSYEQITLTLSVQRPYLLIYSYDIVLLYSLGCIHSIPTCQTLITLMTLLTESFLTIWTDNVQLPVNGPCKSRYLAIKAICTTVYLWIYSYIIVLLYSLGYIQTLPTCQTLMTLITLIIESFLSSEQITLTLSVQRPYLLTYSYDIVLLYSIGCIYTIPTCQTLITLITLIIESFLSSEQITLTLSVHRPYLLTYSYDVVLLYSLGCIHTIPTCQTLITLITLIIESIFIIWTDNFNAICTTTISSDIQLWCCIAVFPRLYPSNTYLPNTDYTDYTDYRAVCNHLHR